MLMFLAVDGCESSPPTCAGSCTGAGGRGGAGGGGTSGSAGTGGSGGSGGGGGATSPECPTVIQSGTACSVAADVTCTISETVCLPAGCHGDYPRICSCRGGTWMCLSFECISCGSGGSGGSGG